MTNQIKNYFKGYVKKNKDLNYSNFRHVYVYVHTHF